MAYDIKTAKELVVEAGKKLVEAGLIARTWGNVSARISDTQFVITPSGRSYEDLTPSEIVVVNIEDCEYEGDIKPSSEKGIHADAYRLRPEVNFVIHTHQVFASAMSPTGLGITDVDSRHKSIGEIIPCGDYGMPSTKKLREGVAKAVEAYPASKAVLMKHHGALCLGADYDEAFKVAEILEDLCKKEIGKFCMDISGKTRIGVNILYSIFEDKMFGEDGKKNFPYSDLGSSKRVGNRFILTMSDGTTYDCDVDSGCAADRIVPRVSLIHSAIYRSSKVTYISHVDSKDAIALSKLGTDIYPYLDDFSQIAGNVIKCKDWEITSYRTDAWDIAKALDGKNAVFVKGMGALCTGTSESDVKAVELVLDKECKTEMYCMLEGNGKPISKLDATIMRTIYVLKYSKQAGK